MEVDGIGEVERPQTLVRLSTSTSLGLGRSGAIGNAPGARPECVIEVGDERDNTLVAPGGVDVVARSMTRRTGGGSAQYLRDITTQPVSAWATTTPRL